MHNMYNISHNYMFRPILGHLQVVLFSVMSVVAQTQGMYFRSKIRTLSLGYHTR